MEHGPVKGEVHQPEWSKLFQKQIGVAVVSMFVVLGSLAIGVIYIAHVVTDVASRQQRVATCILEQLTEHRIDSRYHNAQEAMKAGYPYPDPSAAVRPPSTPVNLEVCKEFQVKSRQVNTP